MKACDVTLIQPTADSSAAALFAYCRTNRREIRSAVFEKGGVLIRGWDLRHVREAEELLFEAIGFPRMEQYPDWFIDFNERADRLDVAASGLVQKRDSRNAPDAAPDVIQCPHVEFGSGPMRPRVVSFFCETPPAQSGETAIMYFPDAIGYLSPSMQKLLATHGWWVPRSRVVQPSLLVHPETGRETLQCYTYSHAQAPLVQLAWEKLRMTAESSGGRPDFPSIKAVPYSGPDHHGMTLVKSDGTHVPLTDAQSLELLTAMLRTVRFHSWQQGDVLLIDNILHAHFRMPGSQPRRLHAIFAEEIDSRTLRRDDAPQCVVDGANDANINGAISITLGQLGLGGSHWVLWILSFLPDCCFRIAGQLFWAKTSPGAKLLGYTT